MRILLCLFAVLFSMTAHAVETTSGPYRIGLRSDPEVVPVGRARLIVNLADLSGKPIDKAVVRVIAQMPGMPMGERETTAVPAGSPGVYSASAAFGMAGGYDVRISVSSDAGNANATIPLTTGESSAASQGQPIPMVVSAIAALILLAVLIRQLKKTGQKLDLRTAVTRQTIVSFAILAIALTVALWAVNTRRRPGAMTPLEAQVMDMNAPAPEGTLPVDLADVEMKPFNPTVSYTGQAVAFVEQDVVARIGGAIVWMPFYVGDKVAKGQVVAKLDTTAIDPMVSEKSAQSMSALQGVDIAQSDYQKALADVSEAEAEQAIRVGAIDEAGSMVSAAKDERGSAEANLRQEQAAVGDARSQVAAAQADSDYWTQELDRTKQLFAKGAVSKDELQKATASEASAAAKVRQAQAGVEEANARVAAARASVSKSAAEITAAQNKLREVQAEHHAHMAHVDSARAGAESAKRRILLALSESKMARAGLEGASTQRSYAELHAESDGMIAQRMISPGVVISPGQSVLKIDQVSPIRLQANIPEADLARIRVGAPVKVKRRDIDEAPIDLTVSSVSPSVDPNSRLGVVEALYSNSDGKFKPGQFVSMQISVGARAQTLVVPSDSIQLEGDRSFAWVAEPSANNTFTVSRHEIKLGEHSGNSVAVLSGLGSGQKVVVAPPQGLTAGSMVTSESAGSAAASSKSEQTIEITAAGYNPPAILVPAGKAFKVIFIRRDDKTCGTEVIFPDLGIRKALPLNKPVTIEIPAQPAGMELNFTCPMNMLNGKAVAQ